MGTYLAAVFPREIGVFPVSVAPSSLASALGTLGESESDEAVATDTPMVVSAELATSLHSLQVGDSHDSHKPLPVQQWANVTAEADTKHRQLIATAANSSTSKDEFVKLCHTEDLKLSSAFVSVAIPRCLRERLWEPLRLFLEDGFVAVQNFPTLLPTLMKHQQLSLLELVLRSTSDLTPKDIVTLLHFVLSLSESQLTAFPRGAAHFLDLLISFPISFQLTAELQELRQEETVRLLEHLSRWLEFFTFGHHSDWATNQPLNVNQIVEWLDLLFDSHFSNFVLLRDSQPLISHICEMVKTHVRLCEEIDNFVGVLDHFAQSKSLPQDVRPDRKSVV